MGYRKHLVKRTASLVLLIALMLPAVIQFVHLFEHHDHEHHHDHDFTHNSEHETNIEESCTACHICSFNLTSFDYSFVNYPNLLLSEIPARVSVKFKDLKLHSSAITNAQLRAPPVLS